MAPTTANDPALERTQLLASVSEARSRVHQMLSIVPGQPALTAALRRIADVEAQISDARNSGSIATAFATLNDAVSSASQALAESVTGASAEHSLAAIDAKCRQSAVRLGGELFDKKVLDPYLQFSSKEDEEEYRKREKKDEAAYRAALAQHTPEGDLLAQQIIKRRLAEAKAHGADRSPEFESMRQQNEQSIDQLDTAMKERVVKSGENTIGGRENYAVIDKSPGVTTAAKAKPDGIDDVLATLKLAGITDLQNSSPSSPASPALVASVERPALTQVR